ncbi:MAG TPA: hypothetical protein ENJ89_05235, partial [Caldithrix abyssi]|nr:hypothetical protein [Caldithrix abyssi]
MNIAYDWVDIKASDTRIIGPAFDQNTAVVGEKLPFSFNFYGVAHDSIFISSSGWISFKKPAGNDAANDTIPSANGPDSIVAVFWDTLNSDIVNDGGIYYKVLGTAPNRRVVVQWEVFDGVNPNILIFEAILYEHSNLIKFQYNRVENAFNGGGGATIGLEGSSTDGICYYYGDGTGTGPISQYMAILFHLKRNDGSATASISPTSAQAGDYQTFNYKIDNLNSTGAQGIGVADRFAIGNPFTGVTPSVTAIDLNGSSAYIQNSNTKPTDAGYATWYYDTNTDSIIVQTSYFDVIDSINVHFGQTMPQTTSSGNVYNSTFDAVLDSSARAAATGSGNSVEVTAGTVAYYTFTPADSQNTTAGTGISYTITAYDQYGNAVANTDVINLSTPGSSTAWFDVGSSVSFGGSSSVSVVVTDTVAGSFTARAEKSGDSSVNGESGVITVSAASADHFTIVSSQDSIEVGTQRNQQVRLLDQYGNTISGVDVTFTVIQGDGTFSGSLSTTTDATDNTGLA